MRSARPRARLVGLSAAALLALLPAAAPGQAASPDRHGPWLGVGLGGGLDHRGKGVPAGHVRGGAALTPRLLVGGDVTVWGQWLAAPSPGGSTRTSAAWNVGGTLRFYPAEDGDFYLRAGAGAAFTNTARENGTTIGSDESGYSLALGAGHDIRPGGGSLVVTPALDLMAVVVGSGGVTLAVLTVAVGFR